MEVTKQQQVVAQCNAINHLATQIANVHADLARIYSEATDEAIIQRVGERTAKLMEYLGDVLNGMDAVDDAEDEWTHPIFERAHAMFPMRPNTEQITRSR